jgi:hypothetical protein
MKKGCLLSAALAAVVLFAVPARADYRAQDVVTVARSTMTCAPVSVATMTVTATDGKEI